jgi:YgiT-type zinc finger domain-containing protein
VACGSSQIKRTRVAVRLKGGGRIANVSAEVCGSCGERYFDDDAMKQIEAADRRQA